MEPDLRGGGDLPLIGRARTLGRMRDIHANGDHLLLLGRSGIGKTRLAHALVEGSSPVERVFASPVTRSERLGTLASIGFPSGVDASDVGAIFQWYLSRWRSRRTPRPCVLWIDDIQHIDELSAAVVRSAVTRGFVQLVATARSTHVRPSDVDALLVEGLLTPLEVPPLTLHGSAELASAAAGRELGDAEIARIHRLAQGYPLYVRELARLDDPLVSPLDGGVETLLAGRLRSLDADELDLAALVAAAEPVHASFLSEHVHVVRRLVERGIVDTDHGLVRTTHPLMGEWLRTRVDAAPSLYAGLARRADQHPGDIDPATHATWHLRAGEAPPTDLAERAVRTAIARLDAVVARRLVAFSGDAQPLLAAQLTLLEGRFDDGLVELDRVRRDAPLTAQRVEAASVLARHLGVTVGDQRAVNDVLVATRGDDLDATDHRRLLIAHAWAWIFLRDVTLPDVDRVETLASHEPVDDDAFEVLLDVACVEVHRGRSLRADRLLERCDQVRTSLPHGVAPQAEARWVAVVASHLTSLGRLAETVDLLTEHVEQADREGRFTDLALLSGNLSFYASLTGDLARADREALRVAHATQREDWYRYGHLARLSAATADAIAGRSLPDDIAFDDPNSSPLTIEAVFGARAVLASRHARTDERTDTLRRSLIPQLEGARLLYPAMVYLEGGSSALPADIHDAVVDAVGDADGVELFTTCLAAAEARRTRHAPSLLAAAQRCERMGFVLAAAGLAVDAAGIAADDPERTEAVRILVRCRRCCTGDEPWVFGRVELPSARSVDVAAAVAREDSVTAIASRLNLSRRTVENHVYRCCRALGVNGRGELRHVLDDVEYAAADL